MGLLSILTMCFACKENKHEDWSEARTKMEQKGQAYLMLSRQALSEKNFTTAREKVNLLRKECELALSAHGSICEGIYRRPTAENLLLPKKVGTRQKIQGSGKPRNQ